MSATLPTEVEEIFSRGDLVAAIAQDFANGEVLMMAWMNRDALIATLESGKVTYWSRSRNQLWRKGETSGHTQKLVEIFYDCDGDALLIKVDQTGAACHNGTRTCFVRPLSNGESITVNNKENDNA
jgi:phosphoribosyl-AMP cyclohydrolase